MLIRTVKKTDENNLRQIWKDTFGDSDSFISWFFEKRFLPEYCVCAEENGKIVSCLHGYPMILNVGGKAVSAVTVSGVSTVPEYRHKGYMAEVFKFLMKKLHDQAMPLVFYTPVNANVYHFLDHLPVTRVLHAEHCTVVHCDKEYFAENISITENIDELWECYETFSQNYSGMVFRGSYFTVKMLDYISNNLKCAVLRENGKIKAYVIYGENNGGAVCEECIGFSSYLLCALDFICKNVGNFSADLPPDTNLDMISGNTKILSGALAGICNVSVLLAALKSNCPLTVNVTDKIIDGNNGTYSFNGMKTEKPADIFMSAGGLVQLLFGYLAPSELLCSRKNNDILEKYFSAKNCFTADLY